MAKKAGDAFTSALQRPGRPVRTLVVGGGGREHALAWALPARLRQHGALLPARQRRHGARSRPTCPAPPPTSTAVVRRRPRAARRPRDRGPRGAARRRPRRRAWRRAGIPVFGPTAAAARIESSKAFAKDADGRATASRPPAARTFTDFDAAARYIDAHAEPLVVKASGLAAGKGAVVCATRAEARAAARAMLEEGALGKAGSEVLVEEFLEGEELSVLALTDGEHFAILPPAQDHKRLQDGDFGPNTGGMGAYCPVSVATPPLLRTVADDVIAPTLRALKAEGAPYRGVLYAGLMIRPDGSPAVIEFNCRFGDPEAQAILTAMPAGLLPVLRMIAEGGWMPSGATLGEARHAAVTTVLAAAGYPDAPAPGAEIAIPDDLEAERRHPPLPRRHRARRRRPPARGRRPGPRRDRRGADRSRRRRRRAASPPRRSTSRGSSSAATSAGGSWPGGASAVPELPEVETIARDLRPHLTGARIARRPRPQGRRPARHDARGVRARPRGPARHRGRPAGQAPRPPPRRRPAARHPAADDRLPLRHATHGARSLRRPRRRPRRAGARSSTATCGGSAPSCSCAPAAGRRTRPASARSPWSPASRPRGWPACWRRRLAVKKALMDQRRLAGVGNIYANEALWTGAASTPRAPAARAHAPPRSRGLHRAVVGVLRRAVAGRGTTVRDYRTGTGGPGDFQGRLAGLRPRRRAVPRLRPPPRPHPRHRRARHLFLSVVPVLALGRVARTPATLDGLRAHVRANAERRPGVYEFLDEDGQRLLRREGEVPAHAAALVLHRAVARLQERAAHPVRPPGSAGATCPASSRRCSRSCGSSSGCGRSRTCTATARRGAPSS